MRININSRNASADFVKQFVPECAYIIAPSYVMVRDLSAKLQRRLHYISGREHLQGLTNCVVIVYGEPRNIQNFEDLNNYLPLLRNITLIHITD